MSQSAVGWSVCPHKGAATIACVCGMASSIVFFCLAAPVPSPAVDALSLFAWLLKNLTRWYDRSLKPSHSLVEHFPVRTYVHTYLPADGLLCGVCGLPSGVDVARVRRILRFEAFRGHPHQHRAHNFLRGIYSGCARVFDCWCCRRAGWLTLRRKLEAAAMPYFVPIAGVLMPTP